MNKKDRDKVKLREVVHRQLRFEMWPLTFFGLERLQIHY